MTNQDYHNKTKYLSKSLLDLIHKSPAHFNAYITGEKQLPTPAMIFGSLVHSLVFNEDNFAIMPNVDRRTKEGKAIYEQFLLESAGKELIVTNDQFDTAMKIKSAVMNHPKAAALLRQGIAETPVFGQINNVPVKIKPDFYNTEFNYIVDLKTTQCSSVIEFSKSVANYRYHVQAAFYTDVLKSTGAKVDGFMFIAVDKESPYNVEVYQLDDDAIERGRTEYLEDIETFKRCKNTGIWNGYSIEQKINTISLPKWY
jgi:exodeoxyribonuclease VIII